MGNKEGFFSKLVSGLSKTRNTVTDRIEKLLNLSSSIDDGFYDELEEILITSDLGINSTSEIIDNLREKVEEQKIKDPSEVMNLLKDIISEILDTGTQNNAKPQYPEVILVVGVNGVGKTTTIGKLAAKYKGEGRKVGVDVIRQQEGSDPAAVVYDAIQAAKSRKSDILICDTAGRLHNKKNLMEELKKINRVIEREFPESSKETLLVLDATTGQNAVLQAREFKDACQITGIVLTKLDGTAKGGIVVAIKQELDIPVKYIGVGEGIDDLQDFNSRDFVDALFADVK